MPGETPITSISADGRGIWLEQLAPNAAAVFEVDTAARLESKRQILESHGVHIPGRVRYVPGDLAADGIPPRLAAAGFNSANPSIVLIEGVLYFLPAPAAARLLDPGWLGLSTGSVVIFDYWSARRTNLLNRRLRECAGREPFHPGPFDLGGLGASLRRAGYNRVEVIPLNSIAATGVGRDGPPEIRNDWVMVECGV